MAKSATEILKDNITLFYSNPSSVLNSMLNVLEEGLDGGKIVDPNTPFINLLECAATGIVAHILKSESLVRQIYPKLANTYDDLYHHIADTQYIGIFGLPAMCNVMVLIPIQSILKNAVSVNGSTTRTIVMPRNTRFTINGNITLEVGYPIYISVLPNGIITARYDNIIENPLLPINNNVVENRKVTFGGIDYLQLTIPTLQTNTTSTVFALNSLSSFTQSIPYGDYYVHLRAYTSTNNADWVEIKTTHSPKVYDILDPTVKLQLNEGVVEVTLPDIYQTLLSVGNSLRIDVITTKGNITNDLQQVETGSWAYNFIDFNTIVVNDAIAPLKKINDIIVYSTDSLWGGQLPLSFNELRKVVIYNNNGVSVPIRPSDIVMHLNRRGYSAKKIIDTVTNRVYVGCKNLPSLVLKQIRRTSLGTNQNDITLTPLGTNQIVNFKTTDVSIANSFNHHDTNRITVLPSTLYKLVNDAVVVVTDDEKAEIAGLTLRRLCERLNNNYYLYSQFYYILDYSELVFRTRVYHLDEPEVIGRTIEAVNENNDYGVVTTSVNVTNDGEKYTVVVMTAIPTNATNILCQLRTKDRVTETYGFLNGTSEFTAKAAIYTFHIKTNYDVSSQDLLYTTMLSSSNVEIDMAISLDSLFDLYYFASGDNTNLETTFDNQYSSYGYVNTIGVLYETVTIRFGTNMSLLYCPAKELLPTPSYLTYTANVPDLHTETVFVSGPYGRLYEIVDGDVVFTVEHSIGDPKLDENGVSMMLHNIGDPILDLHGKMIPSSTDDLVSVKQCGITLMDAKYKYSTQPEVKAFVKTIPSKIQEYLDKEIYPLSIKMNELTHLFYMPAGDVKEVAVDLGDNVMAYIPPLLSVNITYIVTEYALGNSDITDNITNLTHKAIYEMLSGKKISLSALNSVLMAIDKDSISGCIIRKFLPDGINHLTIIEEGVNLSVETQLVVTEDRKLGITDKINVSYKKAPI